MLSSLPRSFFDRPTLTVARELLGQRLVRRVKGQRLSGLIVETEAYIGPADSACHASKGRTARTEVMFGPAGQTYVYLIYGMYHMLNLVTEAVDFPAAVLIRAIAPEEGLLQMQVHRQKPGRPPVTPKQLTNGPGKLCQALAIDRRLDNHLISDSQQLWLEPGPPGSAQTIAAGPRIGIDYAASADRAAPWRFWIEGHPFVSKS